MVRVEEIKCKCRLRTKDRRRIPPDAQELLVVLDEAAFGTIARTDTDSVIAGNVCDE